MPQFSPFYWDKSQRDLHNVNETAQGARFIPRHFEMHLSYVRRWHRDLPVVLLKNEEITRRLRHRSSRCDKRLRFQYNYVYFLSSEVNSCQPQPTSLTQQLRCDTSLNTTGLWFHFWPRGRDSEGRALKYEPQFIRTIRKGKEKETESGAMSAGKQEFK